MLSLSRYLFYCPGVLNGYVTLVEGKSQYTRYAKLLSNLVKQLDMQLKILGFEAGNIGYHSCRKGVATMVASGCTVYPPIAIIYIQVGWVLVGVKDKYLFREKAGDQYVGHCAICLEQLKK